MQGWTNEFFAEKSLLNLKWDGLSYFNLALSRERYSTETVIKICIYTYKENIRE